MPNMYKFTLTATCIVPGDSEETALGAAIDVLKTAIECDEFSCKGEQVMHHEAMVEAAKIVKSLYASGFVYTTVLAATHAHLQAIDYMVPVSVLEDVWGTIEKMAEMLD